MATEPLWYIRKMRAEANRECMEDDTENFMFCDDAIGHCNICGAPIFDGDLVFGAGGEDAVSVDRHGATHVVRIPELMMHRRSEDCREEIFPGCLEGEDS